MWVHMSSTVVQHLCVNIPAQRSQVYIQCGVRKRDFLFYCNVLNSFDTELEVCFTWFVAELIVLFSQARAGMLFPGYPFMCTVSSHVFL